MLRPDRGIERVYLHRAPVDMRPQIDGLAILAHLSGIAVTGRASEMPC
jgi:hypothetical protein